MSVSLKGKEYTLYFDLNTFSAFEDVTGRFFLDFLVEVQEALVKAFPGEAPEGTALQFIRRIPAKQVKAFIWAALHTYDSHGEPQWPMTLGQLGALIDYQTITRLVPQILSGAQANMPGKEREEGSAEEENPTEIGNSLLETGGSPLGPSDESVLASLEQK